MAVMKRRALGDAMSPSAPSAGPVQVTVVESEACHFCADAHEVLSGFAARYPITVDIVDVRSEPGQLLMARHRAPMSPLVLVDGEFFSSGRLPRRKLEKQLTTRFGRTGTAAMETHHG